MMKFFVTLYSATLSRASVKFKLNLFFLSQALSLQFSTLAVPHIFLPTKILKIKVFSTNFSLQFFFTIFLAMSLLSFFFFILFFLN